MKTMKKAFIGIMLLAMLSIVGIDTALAKDNQIKHFDNTFSPSQWLATSSTRALFAVHAADTIQKNTLFNPLSKDGVLVYVASVGDGSGVSVLFFSPYRMDVYAFFNLLDNAMYIGNNIIDENNAHTLAQHALSSMKDIDHYYSVSSSELIDAINTVILTK